MTRRRKHTEPRPRPEPFSEAFEHIDKMEEAVVYRTVTTRLTLIDVVRWLWPDHVTDALRAAYPYVRYRQPHAHTGPLAPMAFDMVRCSFNIALDQAAMLMPNDGLVSIQPERAGDMLEAIKEIASIHARHNIVRKVVRWFNEHATPGAARFYFPGLGALLPAHHAFHAADGSRYKEPVESMSAINPLIRQAGSIVAAGLLADPKHVDNQFTGVGVQIHDLDDDTVSNRFMIL